MKIRFAATATAATVSLLLATAAYSKAHDQGAADGDFEPGTQTGASVGRGGVAAAVNNGARGAQASEAGSANAISPVVGNGANSEE